MLKEKRRELKICHFLGWKNGFLLTFVVPPKGNLKSVYRPPIILVNSNFPQRESSENLGLLET